MSQWQTIRLGSACEKIGSGATPRGGSEVYQATGISLIRSQNIYNDGFKRDGLAFIGDKHARELENVNVLPGDVLLNITGDSVARVCQVPEKILPARVNQHVAIIRPKQGTLDARFLHYFLIHPQTQAHMLGLAGAGATRNALTKGMIESFEIKAPSFTEQRAIAAVLGSLDDKIELNRRMNETLEALAQSLFKSWFVDATQSALPKGWETKSLAEVTELITKGTTPTQEDVASAPISDAQINFLRVNAIAEDGVILDEKLTKIPESVHTGVLKRSILKAGEVVYTIAGTIGRMSVVRENLLPVNCNQAVAIIRPKLDVPPGFLLLSMKQTAFQEELHSNIVHAVQANLSLGMLSRAKIAVPPKESFGRLFQPINDLLEKIDANREESRSLAALRDALLPKLLSGELRVPATAGKLAEAHA